MTGDPFSLLQGDTEAGPDTSQEMCNMFMMVHSETPYFMVRPRCAASHWSALSYPLTLCGMPSLTLVHVDTHQHVISGILSLTRSN